MVQAAQHSSSYSSSAKKALSRWPNGGCVQNAIHTQINDNTSINVNISSSGYKEGSEEDSTVVDSNSASPPLERQDDDYHPKRKWVHVYQDEPSWPDVADGENEWIIDGIDIKYELKKFRNASSQINIHQGNMSDLRILAIHLMFPFMMSTNYSVTKHMGSQTRKLVENDIEKLYEAPLTTATANLLLWCEKLRTMKLDWLKMKNECRCIMNDAHETGDSNDVLASYILFDIVPQLTKYIDDDEKGEDTFVKNYLESFFVNIFSTEESLYQSRANVVLNNKSDEQVKPDWMAYIKPWYKKFNIVACEVKSPSKIERGDISDYVKLGIEMKDMLNQILDANVVSASVFGILVEGSKLTTYAMDFKCNVYRMVQLGDFEVVQKQSQLGHFPALFAGLMQVKNLAMKTIRSIEAVEVESASGKRKSKAHDLITRSLPKCCIRADTIKYKRQ